MLKRIHTHKKNPVLYIILLIALFGLAEVVSGSNPTSEERWAWSTNAGWIQLDPTCDGCEGVTVYNDHLEGYMWGENIGWIRLGTHTGGGAHTYGNTSSDDYGVNRDSSGNLSGYAWGTNVGWIRFDPEHGGVTYDPNTNNFDGYAWSENVGWITFRTLYRVFMPSIMRD